MTAANHLQAELLRVSFPLDKFLQHRLWLALAATGDEVILSKDYWDSRRLQLDLEVFAADRGIPDMAVAASLWNKTYNNARIPAILPAMTLL
ncbi:MAG: hypothetical protein EA367_07635 [Leptolyngbya sp. DLM2.Bin15]|nr:MAG: hypothetical protein EA367_07635 [Leptolyngbya sp. DLM2.Bin15]